MISVIGLDLDLPNTFEEFTECLQQLPTGFLRNWHTGLGVHKHMNTLLAVRKTWALRTRQNQKGWEHTSNLRQDDRDFVRGL